MPGLINYAVRFDDTSAEYSHIDDYNKIFLETQWSYTKLLLETRGHLFINDVLDLLGIKRRSTGQLYGWLKGDKFEVRWVEKDPYLLTLCNAHYIVDDI